MAFQVPTVATGSAPAPSTTPAPALSLGSEEGREKAVATLEAAAAHGVDVSTQVAAVKAQAAKESVSFTPAQLARIDKAVSKGQNAQSEQVTNRTDFQADRIKPVALANQSAPPPPVAARPVHLGNPAARAAPLPAVRQIPTLGVPQPVAVLPEAKPVSLQASVTNLPAGASRPAAPGDTEGDVDQRPLFGLGRFATPSDLAGAQKTVLAHDFVNGNARRSSLEKTAAAALAKGNTPRASEALQAYATTTAANLSQAAQALGLDNAAGRQLQANSTSVRQYAADAQTGTPEAIQHSLSSIQELVSQSRIALPANPLQPTLPPGVVNLAAGAPGSR